MEASIYFNTKSELKIRVQKRKERYEQRYLDFKQKHFLLKILLFILKLGNIPIVPTIHPNMHDEYEIQKHLESCTFPIWKPVIHRPKEQSWVKMIIFFPYKYPNSKNIRFITKSIDH